MYENHISKAVFTFSLCQQILEKSNLKFSSNFLFWTSQWTQYSFETARKVRVRVGYLGVHECDNSTTSSKSDI